jgi:hypothetical protein
MSLMRASSDSDEARICPDSGDLDDSMVT